MPMTLPGLFLRGLSIGVLLTATQALAAPNAKQIADALVAAVTATGKTQASYDSATANGNDITIVGYKMTDPDGDTMGAPSIVITAPAPRDKGGFTASHIEFDGGNLVSGNETTTWQTGSIDNALVPSPEEIKAKTHLTPFGAIKVGALNISGTDLAAPVEINAIGFSLNALPDGTPRDFGLNIDGIKIPGALFDDLPFISALGYDGFLTSIGVKGSYDAAANTFSLDDLSFDTKDVGKLVILAKISGVPLTKLMSGDAKADVKSEGKLNSLSVRFDNTGIVERALDMQAKATGDTRDDEVTTITTGLPMMLNIARSQGIGIMGNEGFQDKIVAAVTDFLKSPKSIMFSASPKEPVSFDKISEAVAQAPQTLPDLLVVDIAANK